MQDTAGRGEGEGEGEGEGGGRRREEGKQLQKLFSRRTKSSSGEENKRFAERKKICLYYFLPSISD